ncbi:hypothetical protein GO730_14785 [Spirosoma sp. HMF3257]|uniref:Uncharacterized protein n=1 Tax=Spirosoma telluris TaxID=2183553 RepID=A0A327NLB6_9BACT|nr:hypothetical protein [Spirosoma telluris]RAI75139.1 hypothetical protein HMF3257_14725 [Spirosoma telluris]
MEPHEMKQWEKVRQKGILRYVLKYGFFIALGFAYFSWLSLNSSKITGFDIAGITITALVGGVAISLLFWYRKDIPYQYIKQNQKLE